MALPAASSPSVVGEGRKVTSHHTTVDLPISATKVKADSKDSESLNNGSTPDTPTKPDSSNIWGSWRRDSKSGNGMESAPREPTVSGYQRAGRGRGIKVLKPARLNTSRSSSIQQQPVGFEAGDPRTSDVPAQSIENHSPAHDKRAFSADAKPGLQPANSKPRSANPIGGASAFGWLNSSQTKSSTGSGD